MRLPTTLFLSVIGTFTGAFSAFAAETGQSERLVYSLMVGGLHVGDAVVALEQNSTTYTTDLKMASSGALKLVSAMRAQLHGHGTVASSANGITMLPSSHESSWSTDDAAGKMTMTFDPNTRAATTSERIFNPATGADMKREDLPWNKRAKIPEVPEKMRTNVLDPMAAFLSARRQVIAANGASQTSFRIPIFDGTRRYDIVGKIAPVKAVTIDGKSQTLLPVTVKLEPVFGFLPQSEEKMKEWEGKLYFTTDQRMIPVQIIAGGDMMSAVMNLSADCNAEPQACATVEAAAQIGPQQAQAN